ncbi:MAG: maltose ABC transporter permease MalG [Limnochordia bacterium]|jgi:arabinogalactan oligomer/maltooligosaccharide transport system permease protein|nr:maltose ABC transporter permease MalG [Bacillota bacterium]NLL08950.1 maltose ABC transporter permease MalG [Bacillota bacterium]HBG10329.1 maltose ABC transporter permease MalG [Bacillota bacterium]
MYRKHGILGSLWRHAVLLVFVVFALFPILWVISASFNPANTLVGQGLIPPNPSLDNYREVFTSEQYPIALWIKNSVVIGLITSTLVVIMTSFAAYAFSRFRFKGRRTGLFASLLIQVFPQMLAAVSIYLLVLSIGRLIPALGLNTHAGLIMVYLGGAMGVNAWLMKGYLDTIPTSLEESAMIDGASPFQAFYMIILPLARPILAVVFMLQFIGTYSELILASVLISSTEKYTLAVGLQLFIQDQYASRWGVFAAASVLGALPIVLLFLFLQKHLVTGLTSGAVKG